MRGNKQIGRIDFRGSARQLDFMKQFIIILFLISVATNSISAATDLFRVQQNGEVGFIDKGGAVVIPITLPQGTREFSEGLAPTAGPFGRDYIDTNGKMMNIGRKFVQVEAFSEGLAIVSPSRDIGSRSRERAGARGTPPP